MLEIIRVRDETDAAEVRHLVREYFDWMRQRYPEYVGEIDTYIRVQDIEGQMRELLTRFAPPLADCLLARLDGAPVGMVMVKRQSEGVCEMNRMYVRDAARGDGVGRALMAEVLATAKALGYRQMMLAVVDRTIEALPLYRKFGFVEDATLPDTGAGDDDVRMIRDL